MKTKQIQLFFVSLIISMASFAAFVYLFPFPHESEKEIYEKFVPWVATRTALYTPYKYWWPIALAFVPSLTFILWYGLSVVQKVPLVQKVFLRHTKGELPSFTPFEIGGVSMLILFLLVNFSYSAFYQYFYNYHHLNFIAGPLSDVLSGKFMLIDSDTLYGFLNIFFASFIFKYFLYFSHANIHFYSMILGCIEYLCCYLIIRLLTRSALYSIAGLFFLTAIHFYGVFGFLFPSELYVWPGGSVWRFFPAIPTSLLLLLWLKTQKKVWFYLTQGGVVVGLLWNIESGVPLVLAYFAALFLVFWYDQKTWVLRIGSLVHSTISLICIFALFISLYSYYTYAAIGQFPVWSNVYYFTVLFNSGFLQNRVGVPGLGLHYWPIATYAAALFLTMTRKYAQRGLPVRDLIFLSFLSVYGYGIYRYYIGKQSSSDLAAVILPAGIIFMYFFYHVFQRMLRVNARRSFVLLGICMLSFFIFQQLRFIYWTGKLFKARYSDYKVITTDPNVNHPPRNRIIAIENTVVHTIPWAEVLETLKKIEAYVPPGQPIAILGYFDHILLMQSGRTNIADYWGIHETTYTNEEVERMINIDMPKSPYLFIDKRLLRNNPTEYVDAKLPVGEYTMLYAFRKLRPKYEFVEDIGMLYVYRRLE